MFTADTDLDRLKEMLGRLPKKQAKSAEIDWTNISMEAMRYRQKVTESSATAQDEKKVQPWEIEKEILAIATDARNLRERLARVTRPVLNVIENEANPSPDVADPFPWFPIGRYKFDSDGVPEPQEPWWGHDNMREYELEALAVFLESAAGTVAQRKKNPRGPRPLTDATIYRERAKNFLIADLHLNIFVFHERPLSHVLPIVQVVHEWATGVPVGKEWGETELDRVEARCGVAF